MARVIKKGITKEMRYKFEIYEKAIGKERPRYSAKTHRMYTPTRTSTFEEKVKSVFLEKYNIEIAPTEKSLEAIIKVYFEIPKSFNKKKRTSLMYTPYDKRPDCDNLAKSILDALNGLAYKDDKQITYLSIEKLYGEENKIEVDLEEICEYPK